MADEPEEEAAEAPAPSPAEEAGSRRPSRMRRGGILVSVLTAASAGLVHLVGGPEAALVGTGIAAAGGSGLVLYHLPRLRRHFNEGRREKAPKVPRAGREHRGAPGRSAAGRGVPRGARSRSGLPGSAGGARRGGSPFRSGTGRGGTGRGGGSPFGRRAGAARASGRPGAGGTARGVGTGRRATAGPRHPGTGHRPLFRRHGGTPGGTPGGTRGNRGTVPRAGSARGRGGTGRAAGRGGSGRDPSAARAARFRPWRRGAAATATGRHSRAHPYARGRGRGGTGGRPGTARGGYRRPSGAPRYARKRGPAGRRRRGAPYKGWPGQQAGRRGRTARSGPPPGLNARVRKVRPWRTKIRRAFRRPAAPKGGAGTAPKRTAATMPRVRAAGRLWRKHSRRTARMARKHGRRVKKAALWTGRRAKAPRRLVGRMRASLLSWGRKTKPDPGPSVKYTVRPPKPADKHMPKPEAASRSPFPGFGQKVHTPSHSRRGAFSMAGFPIQEMTEDLEKFFNEYDPENIDELTEAFQLTELFEKMKKGISALSDKFGEDLPVKPEVAEGFSEAVATIAGLEDHFRELSARFEELHHDELERIRNPRPKEEIWDAGQNK